MQSCTSIPLEDRPDEVTGQVIDVVYPEDDTSPIVVRLSTGDDYAIDQRDYYIMLKIFGI